MRCRLAGMLLLASIVACEGPGELSVRSDGESHLVLSGPPSCEDCRIELREVATLGSADDPASVRQDGGVVACLVSQDASGDFLMSGPVGGGQLFRYRSNGEWTEALGRPGEGPGEFGRNLAVLEGPSDSIYVVDNSQYRVSVLAQDGAFSRSFQIPGRTVASTVLANGDLLLHFRPSGSAEDERSLFYLLDGSGMELARFGSSAMATPDLDQWTLGAHPDGGFWTASVWEYELYRWASPDSLFQTVTREVDWFPAGVEWSPDKLMDLYVAEPPPPQLMEIVTDDGGLVWTYSWVPDQNWEPNSAQVPTPEWTRNNFDTLIEVIDVQEGVVLASLRSDQVIRHACNGHVAYSVVETEAGDTRVRVLDVTLAARG